MAPFLVVRRGDLLTARRGSEDPEQSLARHKESDGGERSDALAQPSVRRCSMITPSFR